MDQHKLDELDAIIVGAGLAGSLLCDQLLQNGKKVMLFDAGPSQRATAVAAGIINPVVFRRLLKTWMADELVPFAFQFYANRDREFGVNAFHPMRLLKLLSEEEALFWQKRAPLSETSPFLAPEIIDQDLVPGLSPCRGLGEVHQAAWLDIPLLLQAMYQHFSQLGIFSDTAFVYDYLKLEAGTCSYLNVKAKKVIFCEGTAIAQNPWFNKLPFKPAKGEILTIRCENFQQEMILNRNGFVLPLGDDLYRVGATYAWTEINSLPTSEGLEQLIAIAENMLKVPFEVIGHEAGVRPASDDRRPVLGKHPVYEQLVVFNGLGSKGVLLAPYFAQHLAVHLYENQALMPEVDVNRYQRFFSLD